MRIAGGAVLALLLAGCGTGEPAGNAAVVNQSAQADLVAAPPEPAVTSPAPTPAPAHATAATDPAAEPGADAAAQVLHDYFAAIADGRYGEAWRLWGGGGQASGMSEAEFARSFARYAAYRATIGTPGRIDAGAGQRYIQIPVQVTGRLRDGAPVSLAGPVTLHRTGDIDGATAEQRAWRLSDSGLKPRPAMESVDPR